MITFTIPGQPFGKQRPRHSRRNGFVRTYTPKETTSYEARVREFAEPYFSEPITGPLRVTIMATFKPAKSWTKKKTAAHMCRPHTQKPDSDNVGKIILDALNGVAWGDDSQVSDLRTRKMWGPEAQTVVHVEAL